jgi:hypothetical protein
MAAAGAAIRGVHPRARLLIAASALGAKMSSMSSLRRALIGRPPAAAIDPGTELPDQLPLGPGETRFLPGDDQECWLVATGAAGGMADVRLSPDGSTITVFVARAWRRRGGERS